MYKRQGVEWGGKWDNCNSIINKYIKKKKEKNKIIKLFLVEYLLTDNRIFVNYVNRVEDFYLVFI